MNLGQGLTMQKGVGETVKPQAFGVHQIRDVSSGLYPGGVARLTLIDGCIENRRFGAVHWRRCGFRLTFDSPSATRADREARPPPLGGHGRGLLSSRAPAIASSTRSSQTNGNFSRPPSET